MESAFVFDYLNYMSSKNEMFGHVVKPHCDDGFLHDSLIVNDVVWIVTVVELRVSCALI